MLQSIGNIQSLFLSNKTQSEKKTLGQFFTSTIVSDYMASQIAIDFIENRQSISILDSGAGMGILSAAAALECLKKKVTTIHIEAYELDPTAVEFLNRTYTELAAHFAQHNALLTFNVNSTDFILERPDKTITSKFDIAIINPPYFKYSSSNSPYSNCTQDLYLGNPNIYASFLAVTLACICPNGQMIAIVPRSFTNGLYFKGFRNYLLANSDLNRIHIFKKRNEVFKDVEVLQENIICSFRKRLQSNEITICSSASSNDLSTRDCNVYPVNLIIDYSNEQKIIRIPENTEQFETLEAAESLPTTFAEAGYFISTGPVVEFRTRDYHTSNHANSVPLLKSHNFHQSGRIINDGKHPKDLAFLLKPKSESHLVTNKTYVILKRITSKDEERRLVAGVYESSPNYEKLGISNKLNYLGVRDGELSTIEANGLSAFLNSTFMDNYFRCISGNTQVNSNEVRLMKFPTRDSITALGSEISTLDEVPQILIDNLVTAIILEPV